MRAGPGNGRGLPNAGRQSAESVGFDGERCGSSVQLSDVDMCLFRALRKLNQPKQRICSALWLSYAEYDELLKRL